MGNTQREKERRTRKKKLGLSSRILIGLVAGIACGLFFGEYCGWLAIIGEGFVDLLQMTVLPYITAALILNIGRLSASDARMLAGKAGLILLLLWGVAAVALVIAPLTFPDFKHGSFFSVDLIEEPAKFNPLDLYIPENPFHSLANNVVPAVVLFSIFMGVALIGIDRKESILDMLDVVCQALTRVNGFVVRLTPYGIFAIAAAAAGTMTLDQIDRLWVYLLAYTASGAVLAFWILPMLVAAMTPFSYRQVVGVSRDAVMTAFATGKLFVVLPLLIEASRKLFDELEIEETTAGDTPSVLVPLAYPFPSVGKLLGLLFIPFAAWFVGSPMAMGDYPLLLVAGVLGLFGSPLAAVPYLLDLFRLPADMFNLFMVTGVWATRVGDVVGAMHLLVFSVLAASAMGGLLRVDRRRLLTFAGTTVAICVITVAGLGSWMDRIVRSTPEGASAIARMELRRDGTRHVVLEEAAPNPLPIEEGQTRFERIRETGKIRIGFNPDQLPYAFFNADGDLVGFDIEMAHRLAMEIGVGIEFVPFEFDTLADQLLADHFDLAMSGITGTPAILRTMVFASSGIRVTGALVVVDHMRDDVSSIRAVRELDDFKLGVIGSSRVSARFDERFPDIEIVELASPRQFFEGEVGDVDALLISAEAGAAWTLRYPDFHVVVPEGVDTKAEVVYPIGGGDLLLMDFVERWAAMAASDGTVNELHQHWILGHGAIQRAPRWSVIRNVLRWVD
jgi:Na+/H+-dicarboxylate symporter